MANRSDIAASSLRISQSLSLIAVAFPILAAAGWFLDIATLKRIHSSLPAMQPNTAFGLILSSIAVLLTSASRRPEKRLACVLGAVVCILGLLTLSEYAFHWDAGIDRVLGSDAISERQYPGRPSPQTAANFVTLGVTLIFYNSSLLPLRLSQVGVLAVAANSVLATIGYIFGTRQFYALPAFPSEVGMAIHTAATFILLAAAVLCSRPTEGMMSLVTSDTRSGAMSRRILFAIVLAPPLVGALTRIGVLAGWYAVDVQISLFIVVLFAHILRTTWRAARQSESDELQVSRAQEETRQSQERLDLALRGADLATWDWDIPSGEVIFNTRWAEMRGYRTEEIKPHVDSWTSGIHAADWPVVQKALADYFQGVAHEYEAEFRVLTKSGSWIWILDRGKVFSRNEQGQPVRMVGTELDITERKRFEDEQKFLAEVGALLGSTLNYQDTASNIAQLAVRDLADLCSVDVIDADGTVRRLKVVSRDSSKSWVCDVLMRVRFDANRLSLIQSVLESGKTIQMEQISTESLASFSQSEEHLGALRAANLQSVIAVPMLARGRVIGVLTLISCSADHLYTSADLRLAEMLAQRAALSIENARLFDDAQRAVRNRDEVVAIVAHDLGNPLAAISIMANTLRQSDPCDKAKFADLAAEIMGSADQMFSLIKELLDFAKLQNGTLAMVKKARSLAPVLLKVVNGMRAQVESKQQKLEVELPSNLSQVAIDDRRVSQVFANLIGNAVKFTPEGGKVRISVLPFSSEIVVCVSDSGPGIPSEDLSKVFDRFWQAKGTERKGIGLGLSIAKGIVEAHGGRIWAESEPGQGSSFHVSFPIVDEDVKVQRWDADGHYPN